MKEFTATLPLKIEITIKAKSKDEALSFLDDLYAKITVESGKQEVKITNSLLKFNWKLED